MLLHRDDCGWLGRYREVAIEVWRAPGDVKTVRRRHEFQQQIIEQTKPGKIITFTVVHDGAVKPVEPDVRAAINEGIVNSKPHVKASCTVITATGLRAAIVRGIIASIMLVTGAGYPFKVTATEEEAYKWLAGHLAPPGSIDELSRVYDELRS